MELGIAKQQLTPGLDQPVGLRIQTNVSILGATTGALMTPSPDFNASQSMFR